MTQQAGDTGRMAEVFPPGEFIRDELEARGWTQQEFAEILGRPLQTVNQIINGKKEITPETAVAVAEAFGTSPEVWLNLESTYRLSLTDTPDPDVARRAHLRSLLPMREIQRQGWIRKVESLDELEAEVCSFLEIGTVHEKPKLLIAARRAQEDGGPSVSQTAWAFRAKHLAEEMQVQTFDKRRFEALLPKLPGFSVDAERMRRVFPAILNVGVRIVLVPQLEGTRIDGAAFWLDQQSPVVALSFRYDRIDSFWFTLMHELAHIRQGHSRGGRLDSNLVGQSAEPTTQKPRYEQEADRLASEWLIPTAPLTAFIEGTRPYFSASKITEFASATGVHPGIVVGRLQHMREIPWSHSRRMLVKARGLLA